MKILDNNNQPVARLTCISRYFRKPDETLENFQSQLKQLSEADKDELAAGAAKELGYTVAE